MTNKLTDAQKRMKHAVANMKRYARTYDKQVGYLDYSDHTFIEDFLYGLGIALDEDYRYADGFDKFKELLRKHLTGASEGKTGATK